MSYRRWIRSLLLLGLVGIMTVGPLSGFRSATPRQAAKVSELIIDRDISDIKTLDPDRVYEISGLLGVHAAYETLVSYYGADVAHVLPDLATSWKVTGGGTVFTFTLRQGVKFSSGNPLTSTDVVFSYERLHNLGDNPSGLIAGLKSITAPDPQTVVITLTAPDVSFLAALSSPEFGVLDSKTVIAQGGSDAANAATADKATAYLNTTSAGTGPFIIKGWTRDTSLVLQRNPNYWGTAAPTQQIVFNEVSDPQTQVLQLEKGDADVAFNLTSDQVATLKGQPNISVLPFNTLDFAYLALNVDPTISKPLSNPLVRQAIRYAIDYNGIVNKLMDGKAVQPASIVPVGLVGSTTDINNAIRIHTDVAKAKALLAQAGYPHGFVFKLTYPVGFNFASIPYDALAAKIVNDLKVVGIAVALKPEQNAVALADYRARHQEAVLLYWGEDYPDAYDNASYFGPGDNVAKRVNYLQDDGLPALIAKADATADDTARGALYKQFQQRQLLTGPFVGLVQPQFQLAIRSNVTGVVYSPFYDLDVSKAAKQ